MTNPTHFAVALKYEYEDMGGAHRGGKGRGSGGQANPRSGQRKQQLPIVENPALALGLFQAAEIDEPIPLEHYKAVAEVISYVFKLRRHSAFVAPGPVRRAIAMAMLEDVDGRLVTDPSGSVVFANAAFPGHDHGDG